MSVKVDTATKKVRIYAIWMGIILILICGFYSLTRNNSARILVEKPTEKPIIWAANPIQVEAPDTAWVSYPVPSCNYGIAVQKGESVEIKVNGKYYQLDNYAQIKFGPSIGNLEFRGIGKKVVVYIYTTEQ